VVGGTVVVVAGGLVVVVVVVEGADVVVVACVVEVVVDGTVAVVEVAGAVVVATVGMVVVASDVDVVAGTTAPVDVVSCPTLPAHTDATRQITVSTIQRRRAPHLCECRRMLRPLDPETAFRMSPFVTARSVTSLGTSARPIGSPKPSNSLSSRGAEWP
jgi:hypothetical protein